MKQLKHNFRVLARTSKNKILTYGILNKMVLMEKRHKTKLPEDIAGKKAKRIRTIRVKWSSRLSPGKLQEQEQEQWQEQEQE